MPDPRIAALIPHAGAMCLLDRIECWSAGGIVCRTRSHLDPLNPLRRAGRLGALHGVEYAMQAAAVHGALLGGGTRGRAGYLAVLRDMEVCAPWLDDPAYGELAVEADLERREAAGMLYRFRVRAAEGSCLVSGRAAIAVPRGV